MQDTDVTVSGDTLFVAATDFSEVSFIISFDTICSFLDFSLEGAVSVTCSVSSDNLGSVSLSVIGTLLSRDCCSSLQLAVS